MEKISIEQRRANASKYANVVMAKYGLTGPQIGCLRIAARKWSYKPICGDPILHDGQVETYNVSRDILNALIEKGYAVFEYRHSEAERTLRTTVAEEIKKEMFRLAGYYQPNDRIQPNSDEVWLYVMKELQRADLLLKGNEEKVIRISDAGRAVAAEFKEAIGAEEE